MTAPSGRDCGGCGGCGAGEICGVDTMGVQRNSVYPQCYSWRESLMYARVFVTQSGAPAFSGNVRRLARHQVPFPVEIVTLAGPPARIFHQQLSPNSTRLSGVRNKMLALEPHRRARKVPRGRTPRLLHDFPSEGVLMTPVGFTIRVNIFISSFEPGDCDSQQGGTRIAAFEPPLHE